jgi:hypothetical protein
MQLRGKNNAASVASAVVGFVLVGCLIGVGGVVAEFETEVLKFGLGAYVVIAGPLFLAALSGPMTRSTHKSFRLAPPEYMKGKRVKPRLRRVFALISFGGFLSYLGAFVLAVAGVAFLGHDDWGGPVGVLLLLAIPITILAISHVLLTGFFVRLGWLTAEEASDFAWMAGRYPPSFLEQLDADERDKQMSDSPTGEEMCSRLDSQDVR